jgi:hypothetical protein
MSEIMADLSGWRTQCRPQVMMMMMTENVDHILTEQRMDWRETEQGTQMLIYVSIIVLPLL